jgi:hypothetical protein
MMRFILAFAIVNIVHANEYLVAENICFSAVDTPATFISSVNGPVNGVRLEYVSGAVSCNKNSPPERCSHWGCGPLPETSLGTFITSSDHTVLAPNLNTVDFIQDDRYIDRWYNMENGDPNSDNLRFQAINGPFFDARDGTTYLIQYGEALGSQSAHDNIGSTCVNVYFEIMPTCEDETQNGDESGVDCGGSCNQCPSVFWIEHQELICNPRVRVLNIPDANACKNACAEDAECKFAIMRITPSDGPRCYSSTEECELISPGFAYNELVVYEKVKCDDALQNGDETGVDCGGSCDATCINEHEMGHQYDWTTAQETCRTQAGYDLCYVSQIESRYQCSDSGSDTWIPVKDHLDTGSHRGWYETQKYCTLHSKETWSHWYTENGVDIDWDLDNREADWKSNTIPCCLTDNDESQEDDELDSWETDIQTFDDTSSLRVNENKGDVTFEFKYKPSDTYNIEGLIGNCNWDFILKESEDENTLTTRAMTFNDLNSCFDKTITEDHIVFNTNAELSLIYQEHKIVTIRTDVTISYKRTTTAEIEFSIDEIIINRDDDIKITSDTPSEVHLYEDENCQTIRTSNTYDLGEKMFFKHTSTNGNVQLAFNSAKLAINKDTDPKYIDVTDNITPHSNNCLEKLAPVNCVGQKCGLAITSDIMDHVGTLRRLLSVARKLTNTGTDTIYLEFHVEDNSFKFPFESIIFLIGICLFRWCYVKFFKKQAQNNVMPKTVVVLPNSKV